MGASAMAGLRAQIFAVRAPHRAMFTPTDEDIDALIAAHRAVPAAPDKAPLYSLRDLLRFGMLYAYGERHYHNGAVVPCQQPFSLFAPHSCRAAPGQSFDLGASSLLEIRGVAGLDQAGGYAAHSWAGCNMALVTAQGELHAYFKRDLLFRQQVPAATTVLATATQIHLGLASGEVMFFDPLQQRYTVRQVHGAAVTEMRMHDGELLTASEDGTLHYRRTVRVSGAGVACAVPLADGAFACACADRTVVVAGGGAEPPAVHAGHRAPIRSITAQDACVSSSEDGFFGVLRSGLARQDGAALAMLDFGCSRHCVAETGGVVGYGLESVKLIDIAREAGETLAVGPCPSADVSHALVAHAAGNDIVFRDIRTRESFRVALRRPISTVSFSEAGSMLLAVAGGVPYLLNYRCLR